jgi:hypothetical protein
MSCRWLALAVVLAACGDPVGPDSDAIVVSMARQGAGETVVVAITLENQGGVTISSPCAGLFLERQIPDGWELATGPTCIPGASAMVGPGQSRTVSVSLPAEGHRYRPTAVFTFAGEAISQRSHGPAEQW